MHRLHLAVLSLAALVTAAPAGAVTHTVNVTSNQFTPKNLTITVGDVVLWQWVSGSHTTTSGTAPPGNGLWNANLNSTPANRQFMRTFSSTGTFPYFCTPHFSLGMTGSIIVNPPPNTAPVVTNPGPQNGDEGVAFSVLVSATDPENNPLTMSDLGTTPAWATFTDNGNRTARIQGTPPFGAAATFPVSVRATDTGGLSDTEAFDIVIAPTTATVVDVQGTGAAAHGGHAHGAAGSALPLGFDPPLVTIDAGDEVAWNWVEGSHTTTSGSSSDPMHNPGALWDRAIDAANPIFFRTFNDPGVYDYFCRPHEGAGMKGRVLVRATTGIGDNPAMGSVPGLRAFPNPFAGAVDLLFRLPEAQTVRIDVFDLEGRRIRGLAADALPAGEHVVRWDGEDASGRPAAAGVYLVRVASAGETRVAKVFKTR